MELDFDEKMMINVKNGDIDSLVPLFDKYHIKLYNFFLRLTRNRETAEDLTSNTFFKALDYIKKKNPKIKNFSAWIYKIATNELLKHHGIKTYSAYQENITGAYSRVIHYARGYHNIANTTMLTNAVSYKC